MLEGNGGLDAVMIREHEGLANFEKAREKSGDQHEQSHLGAP
jgi:hypothetical protein